jgi:subtilisin family serine protease
MTNEANPRPIKIAVLDTGIDISHPAFAGKLLPGRDFVDDDNDPSEVGVLRQGVYGHGTHVAGIIAQTAPDAKIVPIRVLDTEGSTNLWVLAEALRWAVNPDGNPNTTTDSVDVINLSLGTAQETRLVHDLLEAESNSSVTGGNDLTAEVGRPNVVVVSAAGNSGLIDPFKLIYPAQDNADGNIAVGASTRADTIAAFSTRGDGRNGVVSRVRVFAPGENIVSALPGGRYAMWSGTSMAAPFAAGVAALIRARYPNLTSDQVADQLEETAVRRETPQRWHRIDALCAVQNIIPCPIPAQ